MADEEEEAVVVEKLMQLFAGMGASPDQSATMARQLWKRSAQLARERDVKQVEALDALIRLTVSGFQGTALPELSAHRGLSGAVNSKMKENSPQKRIDEKSRAFLVRDEIDHPNHLNE